MRMSSTRGWAARYERRPERERERVRRAYWQALDEAMNERDSGRYRLGLRG